MALPNGTSRDGLRGAAGGILPLASPVFMPLLHLANALLTGALVASMALTYGALPERQPRHFGFDGSGDAWIFTTPAQVWLLLLIGPGTALL